jgi:hypothetical protein
MQSVGRIGRGIGVGTGAGGGALMGAGFGLYFGFIGALLVWAIGGGVGPYIAVFLVLPACVLGGAFLGARLFLGFRVFATELRQRHRRAGTLTWILGSVLLALLAGIAALLAATFVYFLVG